MKRCNDKKKEEARYLKGHKKKLHRGICLNDTKNYSFSQRSIGIWNEIPKNVQQLKEKLDKCRYRDRTINATKALHTTIRSIHSHIQVVYWKKDVLCVAAL